MNPMRPAAEMPEGVQEALNRHADALEAGFYSEADELGAEVMEQIAQHVAATFEDDPDLREQMLAWSYERAGRWDDAGRLYEQRLRRIDRNNHVELAGRYRDLAFHHCTMGELNLAAMYAAEATNADRAIGMDDLILPYHLPLEAQIAQRQGRFTAAREIYDEALVLLLSQSRGHDLMRAKLLIGRARTHFELHDLARAIRDHDLAWELLSPQSVMELARGVQDALGEWWTLAAELWEVDGDLEQASYGWEQANTYMRRSVELWDEGCPKSLLPLARWLTRYGDFLTRIDQSEDADECYTESDQIRRRFKLPPLPRTSVPGSSLGRN